MFRIVNKRGNSHRSERIALMKDFVDCFEKDCIDCLLADRKIVREKWLAFLNENKIWYHIRIRNNFKVYCPKKQKEIKARHLFSDLKIGYLKHCDKIIKLGINTVTSPASRPSKMENRIFVSWFHSTNLMRHWKIFSKMVDKNAIQRFETQWI